MWFKHLRLELESLGSWPPRQVTCNVLCHVHLLCTISLCPCLHTRIWRCRLRSEIVAPGQSQPASSHRMEAGRLVEGCSAGRCCRSTGIDPVVLPCRDGGRQSLQAGAISSGWSGSGSNGISPPTDTLQYNSSDLGCFNEPIWSVVTSRKMLLLIASEVATKSQVVVYCKFYAHLQRQGSTLGRDWPLLWLLTLIDTWTWYIKKERKWELPGGAVG